MEWLIYRQLGISSSGEFSASGMAPTVLWQHKALLWELVFVFGKVELAFLGAAKTDITWSNQGAGMCACACYFGERVL